MRPNAVIFDVDGTLCDVRSVLHHVVAPVGETRFTKNFHKFHADSIDCPPNAAVVQALRRAAAAGFTILIVTAREDKWSFLTTLWLADNGIEFDELFMRRKGDFRPDAEIKREIERTIRKRFSVRLAVDDRADIIEVWHAAGIPTARVTVRGTVRPTEWPADAPADRSLEQTLSGLINA